MTEQEYFSNIRKIRRKIAGASFGDIASLEKELSDFAQIKPVRLPCFLANAELMLKKSVPKQQIRQFLNEKVQLHSPEQGLCEYFKISEKLLDKNDFIGRKNCRFQADVHEGKSVNKFYFSLRKAREAFFISPVSSEKVYSLAENYYITQNVYLYFLLMLLYCKLDHKLENLAQYVRGDVLDLFNIGYLFDLLTDEKTHTFVVIAEDADDLDDCKVLAKVLKCFEQTVYLLGVPVACEVTGEMEMADTLPVSLENTEEYDGQVQFNPIRLFREGKCIGDNRGSIISHVTEHLAESKLVTILCSGELLDELQIERKLKHLCQRLSVMTPEFFKKTMAFAWTGDYFSYISRIYKFNAREKLTEDSQYRFSIVIPVRNSVNTLRYTLQTCLEQRFQGTYEIVLSDNSSAGETEVHALYCELDDRRIRYIKAPRELPLAKSFEFAFLQARGEFVFSIGADDGILPWALEVMDGLLKTYPEEDVFVWKRGFYAWPGFNDGQQHQFVIPSGAFNKTNLKVEKIPALQLSEMVLQNSNCMYMLPNLYINSGYRRRYLHKVLEKTGGLWAGESQDIYMGTLNCAINDKISFLDYPLTIAGMANSSIGYSGIRAKHMNVQAAIDDVIQTRPYDHFGTYIASRMEYLTPYMGGDPRVFYNSVINLTLAGVFSMDVLKKINWKKIYLEMAQRLSIEDALFEKKLGFFRYSAQIMHPDMLAFVEEHICRPLLIPRVKQTSNDGIEPERLYQIEDGKDGSGMVLDASEFGVKDIHGAVKLFEEISGL